VRTKDQMNFCNFMHCFLLGIEAHHLGEEERFFPVVERMTGEPGIMEKNVSQAQTRNIWLELRQPR